MPIKHKPTQHRLLCIICFCLGVATALVVGLYFVQSSSGAQISTALPSAEVAPPAHSSPPVSAEPSTTTPSTRMEIEPSQATALYIPSENLNETILTPILQMPTSCQAVIEPPIGTTDQGEVFQCGDFGMPGTKGTANVVLAGHSATHFETVFNRLFPQGEALLDRSIFLQTEASDEKWLQYTVTAVYSPKKVELPYMWEVWQPVDGRLLLITCIQNADGSDSDSNFVVVADFAGVQTGR